MIFNSNIIKPGLILNVNQSHNFNAFPQGVYIVSKVEESIMCIGGMERMTIRLLSYSLKNSNFYSFVLSVHNVLVLEKYKKYTSIFEEISIV